MSYSELTGPKTVSLDFLSGGGEMGERIRNFDWSKSPLGKPENWSQSLKSVVSLMLANRFPMVIWWGKEYIQFYNDPYIPIPGLKHPKRVLGQPAHECWEEIWNVIGPLIDTPFNGGPATWMDDILLKLNRNNFIEETHFTIAYSPVPDVTVPGGIGGVLATVNEITESVIAKRQMETLKELGKNISATLSEAEVYEKASDALATNLFDLPFSIIYKVEGDGAKALMAGASGLKGTNHEFLTEIDLHNSNVKSTNVSRAIAENKMVESVNDGRWKNLPKGEWDIMPKNFVHIPIKAPNKKFPLAILTVGLNPYRKFDDGYENFLQLVADQLSLGINNALAYEEERKRAKALEELDKTKTIFFSNISHEFRTPLTLMLGTVEEALDDPGTPPENRERMEVTHRNAMRLLRLVNNLLDFSRIEAGRGNAQYQLTNLSKLTADLASSFRSVIENGGLTYTVSCELIAQPVYLDKGMWEKIVLNLLSNAFKYTLEGGISVLLTTKNDHVELAVKDTGVGIPEKELPKMFQRFHRIENVTGRSYEGTGIGLSLVSELIKLHGGEISVTSKLGVGSTFTVRIPFGNKHLPQDQLLLEEKEFTGNIADAFIDEAKTLIPTPFTKGKQAGSSDRPAVLVVDDNADMREYLSNILAGEFQVTTAINGMDALAKIKTAPPDIVLSDIMMPVMDGIRLLKEIKSNNDTAQIPVIFLTARAGEESRIEGYETGADDYLVKPFSSKELKARIEAQIKIRQKRENALQTVYKLFDEVPFAVVALKGESLVIDYINKYNLDIWQQRKEDVIGKPLFVAKPDIKNSVESIHASIFKTGRRSVHREIPVEFSAGSAKETRYFDAVIDPMFDEQGKVIGQLATSIDITDKVLARKKIEESEKQFRMLANSSPGLIWVNGLEGCEFVNQAYLDFLGVMVDDIRNYDWAQFVHPDDRHSYLSAYQNAFLQSKTFEAQFRFRRADGEYRWMKSVGLPRLDVSGKMLGYIGTTTDVHDIKSLQEKIKESEAQLKLVTDAMPSLISYVDKNEFYQFNNQGYEDWFNISADTIRGRLMKDVLGEKAYSAIKPYINQVLKGEKVTFESSVEYKTGGRRHILATYIPHKDQRNEVLGFYALVNDITERKKVEEQVKQSEEKNRLFVEYSPAAMAMFDKEMRYLSASKQWMKEYDLDGDIIGQKHYELFPNILDRWKAVHSRCMEGAVEKTDEDYYIKDDGTPVWLKWEVHPWYDATGKIGGIVIFTENITQRKKSEQIIKESEERFRTMASEAPLFVWVTDGKLQTTYLNKAGLDYFNLPETTHMHELSWKKYIHPDDLPKVLRIMKNAAALHESYTLEMRLKNGQTNEYRWFLDKGAPRYINGKFTGFIGTSLDIHERREAEKELEAKVKERTKELATQNKLLKKQNDLVKKIFDASVDAIAVYDTDMRIITLNQSSLNIFGGKPEEVIGKQLLEILPQIEGTKGHNDLLRAINGEFIHNKIYYSTISERYYENSLIPLKDDNDHTYAVLVIAHDNTDLITSAKKLNEAQQIAQIGHWDWDVKTGDLMWSDNLYNIYGMPANETIDFTKFISIVHPDDRSHLQTRIENAFETKTFDGFFHRIITPAGKEKIMHARGEVITDKDGRVIRLVGTGQDVTQQKLLERRLIETNKKFEERNRFVEKLISSSLDLIMVVDKDLRFITINKKAESVLGKVFKGSLIGEKITTVNPSIVGTQPHQDLLNAFQGKIIIRDKVKSTIGSEAYYEHNYVPLYEENGEVYAVMVISHDITENIRQLEELRKLYESDVQKNNFIAMASHELKTPVTSIKGYVQLILNAFDKEKGNPKNLSPLLVRSSLISVDKQITRLTRLISELLDLSKIETGTLELKKEKFSLNQLAIETVEDILYTNTKHRINLFHDFECYVDADKDRIGQVMINFLTNAIKYSPNSDRIDVRIHREKQGEISFSVRDYGIGIDKEEQKKIFERFYRARGKEEQTYPGFGIGLFIANEFVQKHGGRLKVESEKGKGSVFTFVLPTPKI